MRFEQITPGDIDRVFDILEKSFPVDEYRPLEQQKALILAKKYTVYALYDGDSLVGFISVWDLATVAYVEHLAVALEHRGKGHGSMLLRELSMLLKKRICLEVEPPLTSEATRRIAFYRRNGFYLNSYPYLQPAYSQDRQAVPLLLMTTQAPLTQTEFDDVKSLLYHEVYQAF